MPKRWDIQGKINAFKKLERTLPKRVGNIALNHFLQSWDDEAFSDATKGSDAWAKRKTQTKRDKTAGRRQLLIQTGHLKRSMRVAPAPTFRRIAVGSYGIKYATFHNNGTSKLPKRQFVGRSRLLNTRIKKLIRTEISKIL